MAVEESILNLTDFVSVLPLNIIDRIEGLIIILKAIGIAVIAYFIYAIVMFFINFRRAKKIKNIEEMVNSIDKKLNILLKNKKKSK